MKLHTHYFLIILCFIPVWINAQVFPAQVTPQVLPPYSLKLSEYGTAGSEKLIVNLLFTDITESNVQVRLKFFLENNAGLSIQSTDFVVGANPIVLDGGVPLRLTNLDLQAYFSLQNLLGISPQQYNRPLPEGLYKFCFEVYDVFSDRRISRKSCIPVYLVLNDPPFLNIPGRGEQVLLREPQNIIFQWTPRHLNATNVSYEYTLTELWDTQMNPQAAFLAGRPLYQTTIFATTLLYGPGEPPLLPDKKYGWRVRAMVSDGISETSVFKNDGYSEIYYFTHTGSCAEPESILAEAKNNTTEKIYWQGVDHTLYDIQYRQKTASASEKTNASQGNIWFHAGTQNEYTTIYNLKPGTTYEFRVGGQCIANGPYTYSQIYEFTTTLPTDNDTTYNCGITPEIVITNQESIQQLVINETFTAGDFPVTIKEVIEGNDVYTTTIPEKSKEGEDEEDNEPAEDIEVATGQEKTFSGWGYIMVPYLNDTKIKVSFENIKINTDYQLIDGIVETDYDKNWGGLVSVNDILDVFEGDNDVRTVHLDYDITIDNISIGADGTTIEITHPISGAVREEPGGDDVTIMDTNPDGSRDIFHVDADGNIREGGQMAEGGAINPQSTAGVDRNGEVIALTAQGIKVEFLESADYAYGFDEIPSGQEKILGKYYRQIKDTQGKPYNIINKSVGNGEEDIIRAKVTISDPTLSIGDLVIKTIHGENVPYKIEANGIINLQIKGYYTFEHENIYATIQAKKNKTDKQTIAGVFSQWHLANKDVNVTIVPVNGANLPSADVLGSKINAIFKQASVTFSVTIAPEMGINKSQVGVNDSGVLSNYTSDQKDIINQFKSSGVTNRESYYVFVFGNGIRPSRPSVAGFMPLKRQFGFVFSGNLSQKEEGKTSLAGTLAHELGHGAFALQHPFKKLGTTTAGTDWLMDYGKGMLLSHIDWAQIHNPEFRLYLFQDDEDGALTFSALTPDWKPFTYSGDGVFVFSSEIEEPNGAVFEIVENGTRYKWNSQMQNYYNEDFTKILDIRKAQDGYIDQLALGLTLKLLWNKGNCRDNEFYTTTWGYVRDKRNLDLNNRASEHEGNISLLLKGSCDIVQECSGLVIAELEDEINELKAISETVNNANTINIPDLVAKVNAMDMCGLKELDYEVVKSLLEELVTQNFDEENKTEMAMVKLMEVIHEDKRADFSSTVLFRDNGMILSNLLRKIKNIAVTGLSEDSLDSYAITTLANIVSKEKGSDTKKWHMFNTIVREKYQTLGEVSTRLAMQTLMTSLESHNQEQQDQIPAIMDLFVDMLNDPNLRDMRSKSKHLNHYKILFDIATVRNEYKVRFARFTMTDFIELRIRNLTGQLLEPETIRLYYLEHVSNFSWILPSPMERFGVILPKVEERDLYNNFKWSKYISHEGHTIAKLYQDPDHFLSLFYQQLLIHLDISKKENEDFWRNIGAVNCSNITDIIRHLNLNEDIISLKDVSGELKKQIVFAFFECNHTVNVDNVTHVVADTNNSLMKVLSSFDSRDKTILTELERIGFKTIKDKLRTAGFNEFIVWVSMQIRTSGKVQIPIRPYGIDLEDKSKLFQLEANIFELRNFSGDLEGNQIEIEGEKMAYNQLVMVYVRGSFNFLGNRYKRGSVLLIPLIEAYAMSENNQSTVIWNSVFLTLDVISVAMPIAGGGIKLFRLAGHTVKKTILAADIAASTSSAIVAALNEDAIDPDLRFKIQMASLATSVPSLFSSIPKGDLPALKNNLDARLNDLNITNTSRDILKRSYRVSLTQIPGVPDELADAFKADFPNLSRADDLDEDFFDGWVKYRTGHPDAVICH